MTDVWLGLLTKKCHTDTHIVNPIPPTATQIKTHNQTSVYPGHYPLNLPSLSTNWTFLLFISIFKKTLLITFIYLIHQNKLISVQSKLLIWLHISRCGIYALGPTTRIPIQHPKIVVRARPNRGCAPRKSSPIVPPIPAPRNNDKASIEAITTTATNRIYLPESAFENFPLRTCIAFNDDSWLVSLRFLILAKGFFCGEQREKKGLLTWRIFQFV